MSPRRPVGPTGPLEIGVKLTLHPQDRTNWIHVQRSDDGTTGTIEREWEVPGTQGELLDRRAPTKSGKYYRTRGIGTNDCTDPSPWSNWRKARATASGTRPTPRNPVGREVPHQPGSKFNMEQKAGLAGQVWTNLQDGTISTRDPDGNACSGVAIDVFASTGSIGDGFSLRNGGETVDIPGTTISGLTCNELYYVYYDHADGQVKAEINQDVGGQGKLVAQDWDHMLLGSITTTEDRTDSFGTVCGGCGGSGSTNQDTRAII